MSSTYVQLSLNYSHTNAHMAGSICATRAPSRSSGRRRPPRWRRCRSATHRPALRSIDQRSKSASDPRTLLAPPPIPAATPAASPALQCAEKRRGGARPAVDDEGSAGRASAGPVAPSARGTCRRPDDSRRATADGGAVGAAAACARVLRAARSVLRNARSGGPLPPLFFFLQAKFEPLRKLKRAGWKH